MIVAAVEDRSDEDDDDIHLYVRQLADFLSHQDRWRKFTALHLHVLGVDKSEADVQEIMRLFIDFCRDTMDDERCRLSPSPFINHLLSIRCDGGHTPLSFILHYPYDAGNRNTWLEGFVDVMKVELVRQGREAAAAAAAPIPLARRGGETNASAVVEDEGLVVDVDWLLVPEDLSTGGGTALHYRHKSVLRMLPLQYLSLRTMFKLCTAKDSRRGGTPLHGMGSHSDAEFCSALVDCFRQTQAASERRLKSHMPSTTTSNNNNNNPTTAVAINIISSKSSCSAATTAADQGLGDGTPTASHVRAQQQQPPTVDTPPIMSLEYSFLNARDNNGRSPLHTATSAECIQALLSSGASMAETDNDGISALTAAYQALLMNKALTAADFQASNDGEDVEGPNAQEFRDKLEVCDAFLKWLGNERQQESKSLQLLRRSSSSRLSYDADNEKKQHMLNKRMGRLGLTPLHVAASLCTPSWEGLLDLIYGEGADAAVRVDVRCSGGRTPLHMAADPHPHRMRLLRKLQLHGSDNLIELIKRLTFFYADSENELERCLGLQSPASNSDLYAALRDYINLQDISGRTFLHNLLAMLSYQGIESLSVIADEDVSRILQYCIEDVGYDVALADRSGDTLLHTAVSNCKTAQTVGDIFKWAKQYAAKNNGGDSEKQKEWVMTCNASGETALHVALRLRKVDMVTTLLDAVANLDRSADIMVSMLRVKDVEDRTPIDYVLGDIDENSSNASEEKAAAAAAAAACDEAMEAALTSMGRKLQDLDTRLGGGGHLRLGRRSLPRLHFDIDAVDRRSQQSVDRRRQQGSVNWQRKISDEPTLSDDLGK